MAIWVSKDGQREGPYEEQDIRELIYEGTYNDSDLAAYDGDKSWRSLGEILGRRSASPELPPAVPLPGMEAAPEIAASEKSAAEPPPMPAQAAIAPVEQVSTPAMAAANERAEPLKVAVVDVQMPFFSMVVFMIKWALAAIPALMVLAVAGVFFVTFVLSALSALISMLLHS